MLTHSPRHREVELAEDGFDPISSSLKTEKKTVNPRSLKNLRPFKPGQSGNPAGRPKKLPISDCLATLLEMPIEESERKKLKLPQGATNAHAIAIVLIRLACKGDLRAIKEILDRVEGKPGTRIESQDDVTERPALRVV